MAAPKEQNNDSWDVISDWNQNLQTIDFVEKHNSS